jgi:hypothetical protein
MALPAPTRAGGGDQDNLLLQILMEQRTTVAQPISATVRDPAFAGRGTLLGFRGDK